MFGSAAWKENNGKGAVEDIGYFMKLLHGAYSSSAVGISCQATLCKLRIL